MSGPPLNPPLPNSDSTPTTQIPNILKTLYFLSIELGRIQDLDDMLYQVIVRGRQDLGIDRMGIFLISEDGQDYQGIYGTNKDGIVHDARALRGKIANDSFFSALFNTTDRVAYRLDAPLYDGHEQVGVGWNTLTSMWHGDQIFGIFAADNLLNGTPLTSLMLEVLNLYGAMLGHLIARLRTEQALRINEENSRRFGENLRHLHEVTMQLSLLDDPADLYRQAIILGRTRLGFDRMGLFLMDKTTKEIVGTFGTDPKGEISDLRDYRLPISQHAGVAEMLESRKYAEIWPDVTLYEAGVPVGTGWNAIAILWDGDESIGWLACDSLIRGDAFTPQTLELLTLYGTTLGHLITRRRAEITRSEMVLEREKLQMMGTFVANISHDLKTPLSVLRNSLYLIDHSVDTVKNKQRMGVMQLQIDHLDHLIQDLLLISRLEYSLTLETTEVNLNHLFERAIQDILPSIEGKRLHLDVQLDPQLPPVRGAEQELYRAILNLIENAVNYTPSDGTIKVRCYADVDTVHIEVSDTGIGISGQDIKHIFDRYYRAETARATVHTGTGLGLSIVKRVVELHQGEIAVNSQIGEGTTFQILLPCAAVANF
ncbi:MAG: HAMP domain-containing histidine kinase [Chloroflexi bacterium]|nr:HAMP domain-containing histidine kinase [Chloroflexota bacterium]